MLSSLFFTVTASCEWLINEKLALTEQLFNPMVYSGLCDSVRVKGSLRGCPQSPGLRKTSPLHLRIQKQQEDCAHQSHQFLFPQSVIMN